MGGSRVYGVSLGAGALVAGVAGVAADAPALGLLAGAAGAAAGALLAQMAAGADVAREASAAVGSRVVELEADVAAAESRAAEAETALAALEAAADPEPAPVDTDAHIDPVTGMYGEHFFAVTLASRVAAARRHLRPVAVVLVQVAAGVKEGRPEAVDPALVATHVQATLREADTACRLEGDRFGLVLEDTPENGAVWTIERVRRALNADRKDLTMWAGVACYPAHAFDADDLLARATAALEAAKEWRQDRIEVATTSDV